MPLFYSTLQFSVLKEGYLLNVRTYFCIVRFFCKKWQKANTHRTLLLTFMPIVIFQSKYRFSPLHTPTPAPYTLSRPRTRLSYVFTYFFFNFVGFSSFSLVRLYILLLGFFSLMEIEFLNYDLVVSVDTLRVIIPTQQQ